MEFARRPIWLRYGAAVAAVGAILGIKLLLIPIVSRHEPFVLFFAAVLVSAWIGGLGPGLLATALATLANFYFFMPPYNQFGFANPEEPVQLALSVLEGVCISWICSKLQSARHRVEDAARESRKLQRRMLEVSEAEQRRIGSDLHDGLGQQLTGIALMSKRLEQRLSASNSGELAEASKVSALAKEVVAWTHDLCRSLSPPVLEREGLAEALHQLAHNSENIFGISCTFTHEGQTQFRDVQAGVHLYRIAQEAISNAVKHGKARIVGVHLLSQHDSVVMTIVDNGAGISSSAEKADGMGLRIMQYRANMIGARVDLEQRPAGGTAVVCRYDPATNALRGNRDVRN